MDVDKTDLSRIPTHEAATAVDGVVGRLAFRHSLTGEIVFSPCTQETDVVELPKRSPDDEHSTSPISPRTSTIIAELYSSLAEATEQAKATESFPHINFGAFYSALKDEETSAADLDALLQCVYDIKYSISETFDNHSQSQLHDANQTTKAISLLLAAIVADKLSLAKIREINKLNSNESPFLLTLQRNIAHLIRERSVSQDEVKTLSSLHGFSAPIDLVNTEFADIIASSNLSHFDKRWPSTIDEGSSESVCVEQALSMLREINLDDSIIGELMDVLSSVSRIDRKVADGKYENVFSPNVFKNCLWSIFKVYETIDVSGMKRLRDNCGIINFHRMSQGQATRMIRFIDRDASLIDELSKKQVCVVFSDAMNDYNGALDNLYNQMEADDGAMLFFEVHDTIGNGYDSNRFVDMLIERGIRPSLITIAGHGNDVGIEFGDSHLVPEKKYDENQVVTAPLIDLSESGLLRLVSCMKPDEDGNCSIILDSCLQGAPSEDGMMDSAVLGCASCAGGLLGDATLHVYGMPVSSLIVRDHKGEWSVKNRSSHIAHAIATRASSGLRDSVVYERHCESFKLPMFKTAYDQDSSYRSPFQEMAVNEKPIY